MPAPMALPALSKSDMLPSVYAELAHGREGSVLHELIRGAMKDVRSVLKEHLGKEASQQLMGALDKKIAGSVHDAAVLVGEQQRERSWILMLRVLRDRAFCMEFMSHLQGVPWEQLNLDQEKFPGYSLSWMHPFLTDEDREAALVVPAVRAQLSDEMVEAVLRQMAESPVEEAAVSCITMKTKARKAQKLIKKKLKAVPGAVGVVKKPSVHVHGAMARMAQGVEKKASVPMVSSKPAASKPVQSVMARIQGTSAVQAASAPVQSTGTFVPVQGTRKAWKSTLNWPTVKTPSEVPRQPSHPRKGAGRHQQWMSKAPSTFVADANWWGDVGEAQYWGYGY